MSKPSEKRGLPGVLKSLTLYVLTAATAATLAGCAVVGASSGTPPANPPTQQVAVVGTVNRDENAQTPKAFVEATVKAQAQEKGFNREEESSDSGSTVGGWFVPQNKTPSATQTQSPTPPSTPAHTTEPTRTPTHTPTIPATPTTTPTQTPTPSPTPTPTDTPTPQPTATYTATPTPTTTPTKQLYYIDTTQTPLTLYREPSERPIPKYKIMNIKAPFRVTHKYDDWLRILVNPVGSEQPIVGWVRADKLGYNDFGKIHEWRQPFNDYGNREESLVKSLKQQFVSKYKIITDEEAEKAAQKIVNILKEFTMPVKEPDIVETRGPYERSDGLKGYGIDIYVEKREAGKEASAKKPVYAAYDGEITQTSESHIVVKHTIGDTTIVTFYGHVKPFKKVGDIVKQGELIGETNPNKNDKGNQYLGNASHVEFDIFYSPPSNWVSKKNGKDFNRDYLTIISPDNWAYIAGNYSNNQMISPGIIPFFYGEHPSHETENK